MPSEAPAGSRNLSASDGAVVESADGGKEPLSLVVLSGAARSERPLRGRGLRSKFLAINLTAMLLSAGLLFGLWEYFFLIRSQDLLERKVDEVVDIQSAVLSVPVWNLEQDRIELILRAILKDEDFVLAFVVDEAGNTLGRAGQTSDKSGNMVTTSSAIFHGPDHERQFLGELTLVADDRRLAALATERLKLDICITVMLLASAFLAAWLAFRRTIEIPLSQLLRAIYSAKRGLRNRPVEWNSGDEMGAVIGEFNDLQARQARYENDLKAARDTLEQRVEERTAELQSALHAADVANKAKSEFLAVMSHELRTPLNGVLGLTDSILADDLEVKQRERLMLVRESGSSLLELLNDLLDLGKIEAGSIEFENLTFDLQELLERVAKFWGSLAAEKGLHFELDVPLGRAPTVHADPTRIRQVLFNLLNNALKFTEQGGIRLRVTQRDAVDPDVTGMLALRFEVIDSGIGIDPEAREKLFKRFAQADSSTTRRFGGSGLGLSICRELSELMNGEVGVESVPGEGSTFWFEIRCRGGKEGEAVEDPWPSFAAELPRRDPAQRALRILVAEDNEVNQIVIESLLQRLGHRAHVVANGVEAVEAVGRRRFDLVLMDVQMPEMDGCTATQNIRALRGPESEIPVIALTANAMRGDRERYLEAGMNDYVPKPIEPKALKAAIDRCTGAEAMAETDTGDSDAAGPPDDSDDETGSESLKVLLGDLDSFLSGDD